MAAKKVAKKGKASKKGGRPRIDSPELTAAVALVVAGKATAQEAAEQHGVAWRTVHRRAQEAVKAPKGQRVEQASAAPELPQGGPPASPPDRLLQDVREILGARDPAALEELEEGLVVRARGPELAYRAWLERPFPAAAELTTDPRTNAQRLLALLEADYERAPMLKRGALAEKIVGALRELRQYFPPSKPPRPRDEIVEELRRLDGEVLARLEEHQADPITIAEVAA